MILYIYRGIDKESVPMDTTHVIVDKNATTIKKHAFYRRGYLVSIIMNDNIKIIEQFAFFGCRALQFIRLSRTLEYIGRQAFAFCRSLEALFLPSTVKSIEDYALVDCSSMSLPILPNDIDYSNVGRGVILDTGIYRIAKAFGAAYEVNYLGRPNDESNRRVHEWLIHHMDAAPFHKLCYDSSVTMKEINDYLTEHGTDAALQIDTVHGMTPLHILAMNPYAPKDTIAALLTFNMEAVFCLDTSQQKTPLEYARDYNVDGFISMIAVLCNHRNSPIAVEVHVQAQNGTKRRRIE